MTMSSPSNSLKKTRRSPLPYHPQVPFRHVTLEEVESPLPSSSDSCTIDSHTHKSIIDSLKLHSKSMASKEKELSKGSKNDAELLALMAQRLGMVENELLRTKREIIEKNEYISRLESRITMLEASQCLKQTEQVKYQRQCQALQDQVDEMEEFLNDYGMVWVGSGGGRSSDYNVGSGHETMWSPSTSIATPQKFSVDFDVVIKHIKELNILAGEGSSEVTRTSNGAQLKVLKPVPITLYNNGLSLFAGPFRPFSDPSTQQVIKDLTDGYFPSELQQRYPEGVPLEINDQRDVLYNMKNRVTSEFPGSGHLLGGDKGPSRLLPSGSLRASSQPRALRETSELLGQRQLSLDQFLNKLPQSVVRSGRVLNIRSDIRDSLQGGHKPSMLKLVETEVLEQMRSRLEVAESERPPTPAHLSTLCIKAENGEQTYILKMKSSETIGDVRNYINKLRHNEGQSCDYVLKTTFPPTTLDDLSATMEQCKLVPSATLYMAIGQRKIM